MAQPDFTVLTRDLQSVSNEIAKCVNLPLVQEGNNLINLIEAVDQRLSRQMEAVEQRLSRQMEAVEQRLSRQTEALATRMEIMMQNMTNRVAASEHNTLARLQNSMLHLSSDPLTVIYDTNDNPIDAFPATPAAIQQLRGAPLDTLLRSLKMPTEGTVEQKRSRLRVAVGLRTEGIIA